MSLQVQKIDSIRWRIGARCGPSAGFVFAAGADDRRVALGDGWGERAAGIAFVAEQRLAARAVDSGRAIARPTSRSSLLGDVNASARGVPSAAKMACSRMPQKKREWERQ